MGGWGVGGQVGVSGQENGLMLRRGYGFTEKKINPPQANKITSGIVRTILSIIHAIIAIKRMINST